MRSRFVRRAALGFIVFLLLLFSASALAVALVSGVFGVRPHPVLVPLAPGLAVILLAAFVLLWRFVRQLAGPVGDVMHAADRVAAGDYAATVDARGLPETRRLARAFNTMTERLRTNEERRRRLFADIAHELRTPLSVIQGNVEGMLDGLYAPDPERLRTVLEETKVVSRLLEDLRTLSTAEAGALKLHLEPVAAADLVNDTISAMLVTAQSQRVALLGEVEPGLPELVVDRVRMSEVLGNVVSNAIRATPPGGSVTVSAASAKEGGAIELRVADTGPGIAPDVLPAVFDRFVKAEGSRGLGLGLAIARTLVEAHGGTIAAENSDAGTTIRIVVPIDERAVTDGAPDRLGTITRPPE